VTQTNLPLDADRLWADVMALAEITDPERPYTRRSFTALFLEGRGWLARKFAEAGLTTRIDTAGNLIGRLEGHQSRAGRHRHRFAQRHGALRRAF
jgi:beta-ureidopropionase / N-carbamoyl-L-amino-acid hydrolase